MLVKMTEDRELIKLYRGCGNMATKSRSSKAHIALAQLEDYVNGTIIQTNRVSNAKEKSIFGKEAHSKILQTITKEIKERKKEMAEIINSHDNYSECLQLSLDVHQLLICIDKVQNLVNISQRKMAIQSWRRYGIRLNRNFCHSMKHVIILNISNSELETK